MTDTELIALMAAILASGNPNLSLEGAVSDAKRLLRLTRMSDGLRGVG